MNAYKLWSEIKLGKVEIEKERMKERERERGRGIDLYTLIS